MIYHLSTKIHKRKDGASAVGKAAYRAAETITDDRTGLTHDYQRKSGVVHQQIYAPPQAPSWTQDRSKLWNAVEAAEKRKDSQLCREIEISLINELDLETNVRLLEELLAPAIQDGMIADVNVHDPPRSEPRNLHGHVLLTMRDIGPDGFRLKRRDWNPEFKKSAKGVAFVADTGPLVDLREKWAQIVNAELERQEIKERVDHRSYEDQGSFKIAQQKVGPRAVQWGDESRLVEQRRLVQQHNALVDKVERQRARLDSVRPTLRPGPTSSGKQAYKKRLIEKQYQAGLSPELVSQIKFVAFPGDPDPTVSLYSGCWVKDQGAAITARHTDELAVQLMFDLAIAKGWDNVNIEGSKEFVTLALEQAERRGLEVGQIKQIGGGLIKYPDLHEDYGPRM